MIKKYIIYNDDCDFRFRVTKASGAYLWDGDGRKLIDFTSGWNVANLGWNHPEIAAAVTGQAQSNSAGLLWTSVKVQELLAEKLIEVLPRGFGAIGRATGGTEANEMALKVARAYTGRSRIVSFKNMYHGQSIATLSLGFPAEDLGAIRPVLSDVHQIDFPSLNSESIEPQALLHNFELILESELKNGDVAAFITEPGIITGWGSTQVAPEGFLRVARDLTRKYETLLIVDEVGTGFSRCGKLFYVEKEGVTPDIITLAKGFANGVAPIGAMVTTEEIARKAYAGAILISTNGWLPVACAAAVKTLEIHLKDIIWEKAERDGTYIKEVLTRELVHLPIVGEVRGRGMEIGVDFRREGRELEKAQKLAVSVIQAAYVRGLHITALPLSGVIQLMPPLTTPRDVLEQGLEAFIDVVKVAVIEAKN